MTDQVTLNEKQQEAVDTFYNFLMDTSQKELVITGSPGTGKTFLMGYLGNTCLSKYKQMCQLLGVEPTYKKVDFTATTNKAAAVLAEALNGCTDTIYAYLNLRLVRDYDTGTEKLQRSSSYAVKYNTVIFIDECSMIDQELYGFIQTCTHDCKIIYVGDKYQLAPVKEQLSPVFQKNLPTIELTEPVRNANQPALIELCEQLKKTVETGVFNPIKLVPGVIDWLDPEKMKEEVNKDFLVPSLDKRFLAYSNNKVLAYNDYITNLRQADQYAIGEYYTVNSNIKLTNSMGRERSLPVDYEVIITDVGPISDWTYEGYPIRGRYVNFHANLYGDFRAIAAEDYRDVMHLLKIFAKSKQWTAYYRLKDTVIDLRLRDCCTTHKAQGSTLDTVYIDLSDISRCNFINMVSRLLYVGVSRAKKRVVFCGRLKEAYGGVKCMANQIMAEIEYIPANL